MACVNDLRNSGIVHWIIIMVFNALHVGKQQMTFQNMVLIFPENKLCILCKFQKETIRMKCQNLFSWIIRKHCQFAVCWISPKSERIFLIRIKFYYDYVLFYLHLPSNVKDNKAHNHQRQNGNCDCNDVLVSFICWNRKYYIWKRSFWNVCPAKIQVSLRIRAVWQESSLCIFWIAKKEKVLHTENKDPDQTAWMSRLS